MPSGTSPVSMVSGAASGIGRHMAIALRALGHRLVLTDINAEGMDRLAQEQGWSSERQVMFRTLDARDAAGWHSLVADAAERFGQLDTMLNVAGFLRAGNLIDIDASTIDLHMDINAKGVMYATLAGGKHMAQQGHGHIINVASIAGLSHVPGLATYCASKHAVRGFSLSVAHELKPLGVHVTVFCPDAVETPMLKAQEHHPEAAMTFGAGRALSLQEVEQALRRAMDKRPLEVVVDVPRSGRGFGAKLANMFPPLTGMAAGHISRQGRKAQAKRGRAA